MMPSRDEALRNESKDPVAELAEQGVEQADDRDVRDAVDRAIEETVDEMRALYGEGDR